jgi:hypothetical protein
MEPPNILGLSFNTRNLGLAVVKLNQLVDYSSKLHKAKWDSQKREMILTSLVTCIDAYTIQKIALSIPYPIHQTAEFRELNTAILALAQMHNIEVVTYIPKDFLLFIPNAQKKTQLEVIKKLIMLYPELMPAYEKEVRNRSKYYYKMFEAIAAATLCARKIGMWRG